MKKVLLIGEEPSASAAIDQMLFELGCRCSHVMSIGQAIQLIKSTRYDLVINELPFCEKSAAELSNYIRDQQSALILGSSESALNSLRQLSQANIFGLESTADVDALKRLVASTLKLNTSVQALPPSSPPPPECQPLPGMIGDSPAMQEVYKRIRKVAPTKSTVLIRGETGTGKELVAKAIHDASERASKPFIAVNCAAIPETLIESELFGHEKGAFTGAASKRSGLIEAAEGGTLFMDEIGELPSEAQARLLRFIQESEIRRIGSNESRPVDVRLIAATHRDLQEMTKTAQFRPDLYYRINVFKIQLPALRNRGNDLAKIAEYLLNSAALRHGVSDLRFASSAIDAVNRYDWPGNIRELENVVERATIMADSGEIGAEMLELESQQHSFSSVVDAFNVPGESFTSLTPGYPANYRPPGTQATPPSQSESNASLGNVDGGQKELSLEEYFQRFVIANQEQMNETELAKKLGISRKCLWERRQRFGIPRQKNAKQSGKS